MFNQPLNAKASPMVSVFIAQRYRLFLIIDSLPIENPVKEDDSRKALPMVAQKSN